MSGAGVPGRRREHHAEVKSRGFAFGWDCGALLVDGQHVPLRPDRRSARTSSASPDGRPGGLPQHRPDPGADRLHVARHPDPRHSSTTCRGSRARTRSSSDGSLRFTRVGSYQQLDLVPHAAGERLLGGRRRHDLHARRARARASTAALRRVARRWPRRSPSTYGDTFIPLLGVISRGGRVLQLRHARATCCRSARRRCGATRPTSTSSTRRTAGRSART